MAAIATWFIEDPTDPRKNHCDLKKVPNTCELSTHSSKVELKEGWVELWRSRPLRALLIMDVIEQFGGSVWAGSFILVFVLESLQKGEQWWGYINASYFGGAVLGGILLITMTKRIEKRIMGSLLLGTLGYVIIVALFAINTTAAVALIIMFFTGPMTELANLCRRTLLQRSVDPQLLPKVFSAQYTLLSLIYGLSLLIMSLIADTFGIVAVYLLAAAISGLAVLVGWTNRRSFDHIKEKFPNKMMNF